MTIAREYMKKILEKETNHKYLNNYLIAWAILYAYTDSQILIA